MSDRSVENACTSGSFFWGGGGGGGGGARARRGVKECQWRTGNSGASLQGSDTEIETYFWDQETRSTDAYYS